jgi:hypothetical protein
VGLGEGEVGVSGGEVGVGGGNVGVAVSEVEVGPDVGPVFGADDGVADAVCVGVGGRDVSVGSAVSVAIETAGVKPACDEASVVA